MRERYGLGPGVECPCLPRTVGEFVRALHAGDPELAEAVIHDGTARHEGEREGFSFAVCGAMYLACSSALSVEPPRLMTEWVDADGDLAWPDGGLDVMRCIGNNLTPHRIRLGYNAWVGATPQIRGRIMVELAALAMAAFESATGHYVDGACMKDPCPLHDRVRQAAHN